MTTKPLMQTMRTIRLYGEFGVRFGRVHRLAVTSVAEAIRALCVLLDGFEAYLMNAKDNGVGFAVFIGKRNVDEERLHFVANNDIRIAPIVMGSKSSGIFSIILGTALIAVSFFIPGGPMIAAALFNAGLAMALGGVVQLLSPQPKDPKSKDKPENEPNYAFNGPVNTQAQGNCVPVAYGRPWCGSAVVSAGISLDDIYVPQVAQPNLAGGILAKVQTWYDFNDTNNDILGGYPFNQSYGGGLLPYETGLKGKRMRGSQNMTVNGPPRGGSLIGNDFALAVIANNDSDVLDTVSYIMGAYYAYGIFPVAHSAFANSVPTGKVAYMTVHDASTNTYYSTASYPVSSGYHLMIVQWNEATKTMSFYLDGSYRDSITVGSLRGDGGDYLGIHQSTGDAFVAHIHPIDEWGIFNQALTSEEISYLWNSGSMMSYSELVTAAGTPLPEGQGDSGNDGWLES